MVARLSKYKVAIGGLLAVMAFTFVVAFATTLPAHAAIFREQYGCAPSNCASSNSGEHLIIVDVHNEGNINPTSGKGVCSAVWQNLGGGSWKEYLACTATGYDAEVSRYGEQYVHGQVRRYYAQYEYQLWGVLSED